MAGLRDQHQQQAENAVKLQQGTGKTLATRDCAGASHWRGMLQLEKVWQQGWLSQEVRVPAGCLALTSIEPAHQKQTHMSCAGDADRYNV